MSSSMPAITLVACGVEGRDAFFSSNLGPKASIFEACRVNSLNALFKEEFMEELEIRFRSSFDITQVFLWCEECVTVFIFLKSRSTHR